MEKDEEKTFDTLEVRETINLSNWRFMTTGKESDARPFLGGAAFLHFLTMGSSLEPSTYYYPTLLFQGECQNSGVFCWHTAFAFCTGFHK